MGLRGLFRLLTYPAICYFLIIYYHAKSNDPDGFTALKTAFYIPDSPLFNQRLENVDIENNEQTAVETDNNILVNVGLDYPQLAPKSKSIKPIINEMCQDLFAQRQILYDLATSCHILHVHHKQTQNNSCFTDFPYYERPFNEKLLHNANVYTAHIESAFIRIKKIIEILESTNDLNLNFNEIIKAVKECGSTCIPLAKLFYNQPKVPDKVKEDSRQEYKITLDSIDQVLQASLLQSQTNILSISSQQPSHVTENTTSTSRDDFIFNSRPIHKSALTQLNDHFEFFKNQKIITPDHIDQKSLQTFSELATNIKFDNPIKK